MLIKLSMPGISLLWLQKAMVFPGLVDTCAIMSMDKPLLIKVDASTIRDVRVKATTSITFSNRLDHT